MKVEKFDTGSVRESVEGQGRFDLLPDRAMRELAIHFEFGAKKYDDRNWEKGVPLSVLVDHLRRHLGQVMLGDRSERHDRAVAWNAVVLLDMIERIKEGVVPKELDDIGWIKWES